MNGHGTEVRQKALTLFRDGARNADVARQLGVPVGTVGYWRHMDRAMRGQCPGKHDPKCPRCDGRDLDERAYSYLLGLYLLVRGLIHSDGCRITNWTTRLVGGQRKRYEYPRHLFTNVSDDIRRLYTDTLDKLGIAWTHCTRHGDPYNISVARKASVALLDVHVGPKY
ncbi:hypothetical protein [Streptomyces sp. NPDC004589]|uniref:hypothetical protein n=1 Tax=Streptomyces sp. NPDC004589 TaxID=3154553 RepID=UPI0033B001CC